MHEVAADGSDAGVSGAIIEVENLDAWYGNRQILRNVSVSIAEGEIFVIMGGSGSGKSTLLRYMLALERPRAGRVRVLGKDLSAVSRQEMYELRKRMGVAFQSGALFSSLSVGENIMLPLREHTDLEESTMKVMARLKLEVVELAGFEHLMPAELSGGMLKRAALARAVVMDPKLLFCDEPSAGLDPVVAAALDELIIKLRDALGMTVVIVTHELESAFKIADRIAVLDKGEILVVGSVAEVRACADARVQNLLNRRVEEEELDPEAYLRRLTGSHET
ncbi:MAG: ABC transporter ATP-binding protein [Gammaproteobacteria bacterium]|nr:ABC transporter ATP-binding protein [Gammaproteobacteria bacterium]